MDDPERVRFGDRLARLEDEVDRLQQRKRPALLEQAGNVGPGEVLHDQVGNTVLERPDVEDAGHVLALNGRRRPGFAEESSDPLGALHGLWKEDLDRDALAEREVQRGHHDPHGSFAEDVLDLILAGDEIALLGPSRVGCHID